MASKTTKEPDLIRELWDKVGQQFQDGLEANKTKIKALVLGPGFPHCELATRKRVVNSLRKKGYRIYIMEEFPRKDSIEIYKKFKSLLDDINPDIIICIFSKEGSPHAVIFEIGVICGHFTYETVIRRLRFVVHEESNKIADIPRYLEDLMAKGQYYYYLDKIKGRTLYDRIHYIIQAEIAERFPLRSISSRFAGLARAKLESIKRRIHVITGM
jgi:hypothetical protein